MIFSGVDISQTLWNGLKLGGIQTQVIFPLQNSRNQSKKQMISTGYIARFPDINRPVGLHGDNGNFQTWIFWINEHFNSRMRTDPVKESALRAALTFRETRPRAHERREATGMNSGVSKCDNKWWNAMDWFIDIPPPQQIPEMQKIRAD